MITLFQLEGTTWQAECRPRQRDIIIWKGNDVVEIIRGETGSERNDLAHEWFTKNVPEYDESLMVRIQ